MKTNPYHRVGLVGLCILMVGGVGTPVACGQSGKVVSSYGSINQDATFDQIKTDRIAVKGERAEAQLQLLASRYELTPKTASRFLMSGGKSIPVGPTANLQGPSWDQLDRLTPEQIKAQ